MEADERATDIILDDLGWNKGEPSYVKLCRANIRTLFESRDKEL